MVFSWNCVTALGPEKNRIYGAAWRSKKFDDIFNCLEWIQYTNVTDGLTDGHQTTASSALIHIDAR